MLIVHGRQFPTVPYQLDTLSLPVAALVAVMAVVVAVVVVLSPVT
jgi:hypothetical protein